jgi:hypothetical protein
LIEFRGSWSGLETLGPEAFEELKPRAIVAVTTAAVYFVSELKKTLTGKRSGRPYELGEQKVRFAAGKGSGARLVEFTARKGKASTIHIASAPGEPPAVLYGNLRNSVGLTPATFDGESTVSSEVGIGLGVDSKANLTAESYARRLEFGGIDKRGVMIEKRPYFQPTIERTETRINKILEAL